MNKTSKSIPTKPDCEIKEFKTGEAAFKELCRDLESYLDANAIAKVREAYKIAKAAHFGQKRQSGEDYITHPIAVAKILANMHMDHQSIMAAIMHDVIEDSGISKSDLSKRFGGEVAELIDGVTKLTQIKFASKLHAQAENFRKMLLAMSKDIRVIIIKLADRLHNMRTLGPLRPDKRRRIAKETLEVYGPIANRLGMHKILIEFEDLGFKANYPLRYQILKAAIKKARGNRREIMNEIAKSLDKCIKNSNLPVISIKGREKHIYSIYKKMRNKRIPFSEVMDVYAFRIIVNNIDTCYRVLGAVHNWYKPVPERFKDYIAIPKANHYQSLHTTLFGPYGVPIEVQIRTAEMNHQADNGIAAHWLYKSTQTSTNAAQLKAREWLKGLLELQESTKSPVEFFEEVKIDLFPDEVYVFTPKGDIMELPAGATAVDFAYGVHSDIGNSCIAAKINRRLAPLSTQLVNGQTVEVITAPGARPNPAWLNFVVTGKARSSIRHYIKGQRHSEATQLGKRLLEQALHSFGVDFGEISSEKINMSLKQFHYETQDDLFNAIGLGNHLPIVVAKHLVKKEAFETGKTKNEPLFIKGCQGVAVTFAHCCRPIPGDPIIGIIKQGEGLVIHAGACKHIARLCTTQENCVDVQWENNVLGEFKVDLRVEVANQRGVLAKLASAISGAEANIDDISLDAHEGQFNIIKLTISVRNRLHLAKVMRRIRAIKVVTKLMRYR